MMMVIVAMMVMMTMMMVVVQVMREWWCLTNRRTPSYGIPLIDNIIAVSRSRLLHFFKSFQTLRTQNAS